jgi:hypothetical protein
MIEIIRKLLQMNIGGKNAKKSLKEELREEVGQGAHSMLKFISKMGRSRILLVPATNAQVEMF